METKDGVSEMRNTTSVYFVEVVVGSLEFKTDLIVEKEKALSVARYFRERHPEGVFLMRRDCTVISEETEIEFNKT